MLLLGLEDSGKSELLQIFKTWNDGGQQLLKFAPGDTVPTVGFDKQTFEFGKFEYSICELGSAILPNWHKFVPKSRAIIFLANVCHPDKICEAATSFHDIMSGMSPNQLALLIFNGCDEIQFQTDDESQKYLEHSCSNRDIIEAIFDIETHIQQHPNLNFTYANTHLGFNLPSVYMWMDAIIQVKLPSDPVPSDSLCSSVSSCLFNRP